MKTNRLTIALLALLLSAITLSGCALAQIDRRPNAGAQADASKQTSYETKIVQLETHIDILRIYPWTERTNDDRFPSFTYEGSEYCTAGKLSIGDTDRTLATLGSVALEGYDPIDEEVHETTASIFPIEGIDPSYALALSFEGEESLYVYRNHGYAIENSGELIDAGNLGANLIFGSAYQDYLDETNEYISLEFVGAERERVWELLFSDRTLEVADYYNYHEDDSLAMSISVSAPLLGHTNKSITVTESGYLWTNLIDTGVAFRIGEDAADAFMHYIKSECKGYQIIYDHGDVGSSDHYDDGPILTTVHYNPSHAPETTAD